MSESTDSTAVEKNPARKYSHILFKFRLPYRLFVDDGVYFITAEGVRWRISLKTLALESIEWTMPAVNFGRRSQIRLDSHGFTGFTEVLAGYPFTAPLTPDEIWARQTSDNRITLRHALAPVNRLISWYRAKSNEFWFRQIGDKDVPAITTVILPSDSTELEFFLTKTNAEIAMGFPYLKTEAWYRDLLPRLEQEDAVPFSLELIAEGRDALARDNLRLAASNFALAAEALFRSLVTQYFPGVDVSLPAEQLMGTYFARYREISGAPVLPMKKSRANALFRTVWDSRDPLLHGHDLDLDRKDVEAAELAIVSLYQLWDKRPGGAPLNVDGPFARPDFQGFPSPNPADHIERARHRFQGRNRSDAIEAARFALVLDRSNTDALKILGQIALDEGKVGEAVRQFEEALRVSPTEPGLAEFVVQLRESLAPTESNSAEASKKPEHLDLINGVFSIVAEHATCVENWGSYLVDRKYDVEPALRNKAGVIWLSSLLESIEAAEAELPRYRDEAAAKSLTHIEHACSQVERFAESLREILGLYSMAEQLFLLDNRDQMVHSRVPTRNRPTVDVKFYDGQQIKRQNLESGTYQDTIRPLYDLRNLDQTLSTLLTRAMDQQLRYWTLIRNVIQTLSFFYQSLLAGQSFTIPGLEKPGGESA